MAYNRPEWINYKQYRAGIKKQRPFNWVKKQVVDSDYENHWVYKLIPTDASHYQLRAGWIKH